MGTIQSKIRQSYYLVQKPYLKKKCQKGFRPTIDLQAKIQFFRKKSFAQDGQSDDVISTGIQATSLNQKYSWQSFDEESTVTDFSSCYKSYPATAIGLIQSRIEGKIKYGIGSLISSNLVLTTANQLYSFKTQTQAESITFFLNDGWNQEEYQIEKAFFSQAYRNLYPNQESNKQKILLQNYGIIVLKTHVNTRKYGLLGFDFSQKTDKHASNVELYGFNKRMDFLKIESIQLKAKLKECSIKYNTLYHFTVSGGPIISQEGGNYTIIGIQNQQQKDNHSMEHRCLRLTQKIYNQICHWITQQEQQVDLRDKNIGKQGIKKLIKLQKTSLCSINISRNNIGTEGLKYLTRCQWNQLYHLDIGGNDIKKEGVSHLIKIPMKNILTLNMWGNAIGSQGAILLLDADWKHLSNLNLYNNNICNEGMKSLIKASWEELQSINLGKNSINESVISLFQYSVWNGIISFNLWGNSIKNSKETQSELKKYFIKIKFLYL